LSIFGGIKLRRASWYKQWHNEGSAVKRGDNGKNGGKNGKRGATSTRASGTS